MFKFYFASFIACFFVLSGFAQKQDVYFLKNNGRYVNSKDSADYIRVVSVMDPASKLYDVTEYYPNNNPKLIGKTALTFPLKLQGMVVSYYPDKNIKQIANFENGNITGIIYDYYPNGKLYRSIEHVLKYPGTNDKNHIYDTKEIVYDVYDSTGVQMVKNGNGHYIVYNNHYNTIEEEGDLKDGTRTGIWKGTANNGKIHFTEEYKNGEFTNGTSTDENGNTANYTIKEALPSYKKGEKEFYSYIAWSIHYPPRARDRGISGAVMVSFVVEKDGSLQEVKVVRSVDPDLDVEAVRVIRQSPKWNPGIQHGFPVKVAYVVPVNFIALARR